MKRLITAYILIAFSIVLSQSGSEQDSASIAAIEFIGTGINALETQTLFNYFSSELKKATDRQFMDQSIINQKISELEIGTSDCFSKECLQGALTVLGVQQLLAGKIKFSNNKYRVKVQLLDVLKPNKPKSYSIRYKGEADGFITELEILAWEIMGDKPPDRLLGKRKPNQESMFEKIAENPWSKRVLLLTVAGLSGASFVSNMASYRKSQDAADENQKSGWQEGVDAHTASADKSKNKATLSAVALAGVLVYGYIDGTFSGDDSD